MSLLLTVLVGLIGAAIGIFTALRPQWFWPTLIGSATATGRLMLLGNTFVDEYFIGWIIAGGIFALFANKRPGGVPPDRWKKIHRLTYLLLVAYLTIQAIRGVFIFNDPAKSRWVLFFLGLGLIVLLSKKLPPPNKDKIILFTTAGFFTYLIFCISGSLSQSNSDTVRTSL